MIDITLLTEESKKAGLEKDPDVQKAIQQATEQVLVQAFLSRELKSFCHGCSD
jgi:hypothetical protein